MRILITLAILIALSGCSEESLQRKECENAAYIVGDAMSQFHNDHPYMERTMDEDIFIALANKHRGDAELKLSQHEYALYRTVHPVLGAKRHEKYLHCLKINK